MIKTFRNGDTIRASAARLANLRKLSQQTANLRDLRADGPHADYTDEALTVSTYAYAYLDALRDETDAATHARATISLDTNLDYAWSYALACRDEADTAVDTARALRNPLAVTV